jgi:hypothetical protein
VLWLPVQNAGPIGLTFIGRASISGTNAADFTFPAGDDLCDGQTLEPGNTCWIGVQLTASAPASAESATLTLGASNTLTASAPTVALTGTGVAANSGPPGTNGKTGPQGPPGKNGKVELVTCKTVKVKRETKQVCTTKLVTGPVKFNTTAVDRAVLSRGRVVYATGIAARDAKHPELALIATRKLQAGRYTLTLRWTTGHIGHTTRRTIMLR